MIKHKSPSAAPAEKPASFWKRLDAKAPAAPRRWPLSVLAALLSGLVWALLASLIQGQGVFSALGGAALWLNALFLALLVLTLSFLTHSLFAGNLTVGFVAVILAFVNYFKVSITSIPLTVGDLALAGQVGNIAALNQDSLRLSPVHILAILCAVVWLVLMFFAARLLRLPWRWSLVGAAAGALVFFLAFWVGLDPVALEPLGARSDLFLPPSAVNSACGMPLGLWRGLYGLVHPDSALAGEYSETYMEDVVRQTESFVSDGSAAVQRRQPNIIMVLSESFFDPTTLPGVTYDRDPVAEFHALQQEGVSGAFYSRDFGSGTCNVELEIFTGINSGLLAGEDLYSWDPEIFSRLPAVPLLLRGEGYRTSLLHMFNDGIYNRTELFSGLGFDNMYFSGDLAAIYPPAAQAESYWEYMATRIVGGGYSDDLMADVLCSQYELLKADGTGPLFLYASSIENHTPYKADKYSPEELTVDPHSALTGQAADYLLCISQGSADASASLGKLTDYFRNVEEPTVIVFFGDHRPSLVLTDGGTLYSALGMVPADSGQWTPEDSAAIHRTDYLIWSNDPDYLPGEPGSRTDTSCNFLGTTLLNLAGARKPLFWQLVDKLSDYRVMDAMWLHIGVGQPPSYERLSYSDGEAGAGLALWRALIWDTVFGEQYVTAQVGALPPDG